MTPIAAAYWRAHGRWRRAAKAARERLATFPKGDRSWMSDPEYARLYQEYQQARHAWRAADAALTKEQQRR